MIGRTYGVDLGTSVIKIYKKGKGIICNQKNMIAVDKSKVLAIGDDAFEMYEKVPGYVHVTYPIKNGVIADIENMEKLFNALLKGLSKNGKVYSAEYVVAVPMDTTEVEKKAFIDLVDASRAKKVKLVAKPIAAALGAGLDVCNAKGAMIVDMGASTTEIAVISLGGIVVSRLLPIGGDTFNDAIIAAVKKNGIVDHVFMGFSLLGVSVPVFMVAMVLQFLLAYKLQWFPITSGNTGWIGYVLPAIALGWNSAGSIARLTRSTLLEVLQEDYIDTARAKGYRQLYVIICHALRNAVLPVITMMAVQLSSLLSGAVICETVFSINGIGRLAVQAIEARDIPLLQGTVLFSTVIVILGNLVADCLYSVLDPRIRKEV